MPLSAYLLDETLWLEVDDAMGNSHVFADELAWLWPHWGDGWATRYGYCLPLTPQGYLDGRGEGNHPLDIAFDSDGEAG
ncbi:putative uncharacterized protein [Meiothermus ruber H328]|nr:putative uncharacterized protein [Meiothermus ruber H328]